MAKQLTAAIQSQITNKRIDVSVVFKINGVDRTDYLINWDLSYDIAFGSASGSFTLNNSGGVFGSSGLYEVKVGDIVELIEKYYGDPTEFKKFYGVVDQRSISKTAENRTITLTCLDYISLLQKTDIDLEVEGTKINITDETLVPQYLPSPNNNLAQIFNFANSSIASVPPPTITIRPKDTTTFINDSPQFDGFSIKYAQGQLVLGTPLNALDNYYVVSNYSFYAQGANAEDILEAILTEPDGYGKYLFGETSAADVIANHLTESFYNMEGVYVDDMTPNYTSSNVIIKTQTTADFDPDASGSPTTLYVQDATGFPTSGSGECNGDIFTWTGKTSTTLTGCSGLLAHPTGSVVKYENTYDAGQVWYLKYSNILSDLDESGNSFTGLPSGVTINYIDYRNGRIILSSAISTLTNVSHNGDYTFSTLQTAGIELNSIKFKPREIDNRFEAINKLRKYLAPNYIIRTRGDNKIWASYLYQKVNADFDLTLTTGLNYLEDEDIFTRVVFYGKNNNPTTLTLNEGVAFVSTDQEFKSTAVQTELTYEKEEGNYLIYKSGLPGGRIDISSLKPIIYINNVPVNDKPQIISQMPVVVLARVVTETITQEKRSGTPDITTNQYFYYTVRFAHTSIDPSQPIILYDNVGITLLTIPAYSDIMDYGTGIYHVPGTSQNATIEQISTASYTVFYALSGIDIDYDNVRFKISKQILPDHTLGVVSATFQYWTVVSPFSNISSVIDGRFDTQVQTEFFSEPPDGLPYAILDLGAIYDIQAIDIIAGFYKPDDIRKFDVNFTFSLEYSLDNVTYYDISAETQNITLAGGQAKSLEEQQLGEGFRARYLKMNLENVKKLEFKDGVWPVAFSEITIYDSIYLKAESKLIPTTELTTDVTVSTLPSSGVYPTTLNVVSTAYFEEPESGQTATAYIGEDAFTYTGLTATSFTGVEGLSDDHVEGELVLQQLEDDSNIIDFEQVLPQLGDRLFKQNKIDDETLYSQEQLDRLARAWNEEFQKNHTKATVSVLYAPYLEVGMTLNVTDSYEGLSNVKYFIQSIADKGGFYDLTIARYPD